MTEANTAQAEMNTEDQVVVEAPLPNLDIDLDSRSVLLVLNIGLPGNSKKIPSSVMQPSEPLPTDDLELQRARIRVNKSLWESDDLAAAKKLVGQTRHWLDSVSVPSFAMKSGVCRIPLSSVRDVIDRLKVLQEDFAVHRDNMASDLAGQKQIAKERLGSLYTETDYPQEEELRAKFTFYWRFIALTAPDQLGTVESGIMAEEVAKGEALIRSEIQLIRDALRAEFIKLVEHATARLASGEDGKKVVFRDSFISNIEGFITQFANRNLTDDDDLKAQVAILKRSLRGVDLDKLRENDKVRERVAARFKEVQDTMKATDAVVTYGSVRQAEFDD